MSKIAIKTSNSPLGGGSVRVYRNGHLVWTRRAMSLIELLKLDSEVRQALDPKPKTRKLRIV